MLVALATNSVPVTAFTCTFVAQRILAKIGVYGDFVPGNDVVRMSIVPFVLEAGIASCVSEVAVANVVCPLLGNDAIHGDD